MPILAMSLLGSPASAEPPRNHPLHPSIATPVPRGPIAIVDTHPLARIRGLGPGDGLTLESFARWVDRHPDARPGRVKHGLDRRKRGAMTPYDQYFLEADANADARISATELADWVSGEGGCLSRSKTSIPNCSAPDDVRPVLPRPIG